MVNEMVKDGYNLSTQEPPGVYVPLGDFFICALGMKQFVLVDTFLIFDVKVVGVLI
jgi:hypothetical protein